ncbi:hypothetical protein PG316_10790, partial [Riemerella anatipestifer]
IQTLFLCLTTRQDYGNDQENYNFIHCLVFVFQLTHNGKSICEGRTKLNQSFNFDQTEADAFSVLLI